MIGLISVCPQKITCHRNKYLEIMVVFFWKMLKEPGERMTFIQSKFDVNEKALELIGQGERRYMIRAKVQRKNRWERESSPIWHNGQEDAKFGDRNIEFNVSLVGRIFQAIFQRKSLSWSLSFNFQSVFQNEEEVQDKAGRYADFVRRYADFVENIPEVENV